MECPGPASSTAVRATNRQRCRGERPERSNIGRAMWSGGSNGAASVRLWVCVALVVLVSWSDQAAAHQQGRSYCSVRTIPSGVDVEVEASLTHLAPALGRRSERLADEVLRAALPELEQRLLRDVSASTPEGVCEAKLEARELGQREGERSVRWRLRFLCPGGAVFVTSRFLQDVDPRAQMVCSIEGTAWTFQREEPTVAVGTPPRLWSVVAAYVRDGAAHVASGLDHVLFVLALLLATAGLEASATRRWWMTLRIVTGFTLGHSATLIAAGLGWVQGGSTLVEVLIALSLVVVAAENVVQRAPRWRALNATLFGLVHGLGFAGALLEAGLPARGTVLSLLAFNVGVELAQLGLVALAFPVLLWLARSGTYRGRVLRPLSLLIAVLALLWLTERLTGRDLLPG